MRTVITKTSGKGNEIRIDVDHTDIIAYVDGQRLSTGFGDSIETYNPPVQVGDILVAGYLRRSKIGLTSDEMVRITQTITANQAAVRKNFRSPINRNQPADIAAEMERADSAF